MSDSAGNGHDSGAGSTRGRWPPATPSAVLRPVPWVVAGLGLAFLALAVFAAFERGAELGRWEAPLERAMQDERTPAVTQVMRDVSRLAGTPMVVAGGAALVGLAWQRSRPLAIAVILSLAARPLLEFAVKALVHRPRPDFSLLVRGRGHSFPSGHVLAAVSLWGVLPPVVATYTRRPFLWWVTVAVAGLVIGGVAFSRVYLGVHWLTDVVGSLVLGALYLLAVEWLLNVLERRWAPGSVPPS